MKQNFSLRIMLTATLVVFVLVKYNEGLLPSDLCLASQGSSCIKLTDRIRCEKGGCTGKWNHSCDFDLCSRDDLACQIYKVKESMYKEKLQSVKLSDQLLRKKHRNFKESINKCKINQFTELALNDFCINSKCTRANGTDCICNGKFKFTCSQFCTRDETICSNILNWMKTRHFGSLKFYRC